MDDFSRHVLKRHTQSKVVKCSICEKYFSNKNHLKRHINGVHLNKTSTCKICHKEYKQLKPHLKFFHRKVRDYECSYCEKMFQDTRLLLYHMKSIHMGEKTKCPICKIVISMANLSRHVKELHNQTCPYCNNKYLRTNLSRHIREVHKKICNICKAEVSYYMSVHKRKEHGIDMLIGNEKLGGQIRFKMIDQGEDFYKVAE